MPTLGLVANSEPQDTEGKGLFYPNSPVQIKLASGTMYDFHFNLPKPKERQF